MNNGLQKIIERARAAGIEVLIREGSKKLQILGDKEVNNEEHSQAVGAEVGAGKEEGVVDEQSENISKPWRPRTIRNRFRPELDDVSWSVDKRPSPESSIKGENNKPYNEPYTPLWVKVDESGGVSNESLPDLNGNQPTSLGEDLPKGELSFEHASLWPNDSEGGRGEGNANSASSDGIKDLGPMGGDDGIEVFGVNNSNPDSENIREDTNKMQKDIANNGEKLSSGQKMPGDSIDNSEITIDTIVPERGESGQGNPPIIMSLEGDEKNPLGDTTELMSRLHQIEAHKEPPTPEGNREDLPFDPRISIDSLTPNTSSIEEASGKPDISNSMQSDNSNAPKPDINKPTSENIDPPNNIPDDMDNIIESDIGDQPKPNQNTQPDNIPIVETASVDDSVAVNDERVEPVTQSETTNAVEGMESDPPAIPNQELKAENESDVGDLTQNAMLPQENETVIDANESEPTDEAPLSESIKGETAGMTSEEATPQETALMPKNNLEVTDTREAVLGTDESDTGNKMAESEVMEYTPNKQNKEPQGKKTTGRNWFMRLLGGNKAQDILKLTRQPDSGITSEKIGNIGHHAETKQEDIEEAA